MREPYIFRSENGLEASEKEATDIFRSTMADFPSNKNVSANKKKEYCSSRPRQNLGWEKLKTLNFFKNSIEKKT
jgi:hypothetical protein